MSAWQSTGIVKNVLDFLRKESQYPQQHCVFIKRQKQELTFCTIQAFSVAEGPSFSLPFFFFLKKKNKPLAIYVSIFHFWSCFAEDNLVFLHPQ